MLTLRSLALIFLCVMAGLQFHSAEASAAVNDGKSGTTMALFGVAFASSSTGIAVGSGGIILVTTDGGISWKPQKSASLI